MNGDALSVSQLLGDSVSPQLNVRGNASQKLFEFRRIQGFGSLLCTIIAAKGQIDERIREAAAINLKNLVQQHWAKRRSADLYIIGDEEKGALRNQVTSLITDENQVVAIQLANTIASMVRHDFPDVWPSIFSDLVSHISNNPAPLAMDRLILTLYRCCKAITTLKDAAEYDFVNTQVKQLYDKKRAALKDISSHIVSVIAPMSNELLQELVVYSQNGGGNLSDGLASVSLFSLRIMRTLLSNFLFFFVRQNTDAVTNLFSEFLSKMKAFFDCRKSIPEHKLVGPVEKIYKTLNKLVSEAQYNYPLAFVPLLEPFLQYYGSQLAQDYSGTDDQFFEHHQIYALTFFANIMHERSYSGDLKEAQRELAISGRTSEFSDLCDPQLVESAARIVSSYFTDDYFSHFTQQFIMKYLKMTPRQLELWDEDAEALVQEELSEDHQHTVAVRCQGCAEFCFYRMVTFRPKIISSVVIQLTSQARDLCAKPANQVPFESILLKDACYNAIALGFNQLQQESLQFEDVMSNLLLADIEINDPRYRLIRRRIGQIITTWAWDIPAPLHPKVSHICLTLFQDNDLIVRMYAAIAVKNMMDEVDPDSPFIVYLKPIVEQIIRLVNDMQEGDTQQRVLDVVSEMVDVMGDRVAPAAPEIYHMLVMLWQQSASQDRNLTKKGVVKTMACLIGAVPTSALDLLPQILPMISHATDLTHPDSQFLLEDGLMLWYNITQHIVTNELVALFPRLVAIYEANSSHPEQISMTTRILEAYILVGRVEFLRSSAEAVVNLFERMLETATKSPKIVEILDVMAWMLLSFPNEAPSVMTRALKTVFYFVHDKFKDSTAVQENGIRIFLRLLLLNPGYLSSFLAENVSTNKPAIQWCLDHWLERARSLDHIEPEKLWACALSTLLAVQDSTLQPYYARITEVVIGLMADLHQKESKKESVRKYHEDKSVKLSPGSQLGKARKHLTSTADAGHWPWINAYQFITNNLQQCVAQNGGQEFQNALFSQLPSDIVEWIMQPPGPPKPPTKSDIIFISD